ncbi:MAG: 30S ribosomal protein S6 [Clostridia bacterium]|nr:30S ribosomal protein S6 [Clostridia bacterium]
MNRYELTYIIDATLEETARKELIAKFSSLIAANGGEVEKVDETWGKRRLAYPIDHKTEGYYVLVTYTAPVEVPAEVERNMRINDSVLRYLTVKLVEKHSKVKPRPVRQAPAPVAVEEAPVVEAAPAVEEAPVVETPAVEEAPAAPAEE